MTDYAARADDGQEHEDGPAEAAAPGLPVTALAGGIGAAAGYIPRQAGPAVITVPLTRGIWEGQPGVRRT